MKNKKRKIKEANYQAITISNDSNERLKYTDIEELDWELNFDYKQDLIELVGIYDSYFVVHSISSN